MPPQSRRRRGTAPTATAVSAAFAIAVAVLAALSRGVVALSPSPGSGASALLAAPSPPPPPVSRDVAPPDPSPDLDELRTLIELSSLAYCDPADLADWACPGCQSAAVAGLRDLRIVRDGARGLQALVGFSPQRGAVVVGFRGTSVCDLENWVADLKFLGTDLGEGQRQHGACVGAGRLWAPEPSLSLLEAISTSYRPRRPVRWFTGVAEVPLPRCSPSRHRPCPPIGLHVRVHRGFWEAYHASDLASGVREGVGALVEAHRGWLGRPPSVAVAGHSLGGALAQLAALDLAGLAGGDDGGPNPRLPSDLVVRVASFGSPRVGNADFVDYLTASLAAVTGGGHWRVTHGHDPVPSLPPWVSGFRHAPRELYVWEGSLAPEVSLVRECDGSGEDRRCYDGACGLHGYGLCTSLADHLFYLGLPIADPRQCAGVTPT